MVKLTRNGSDSWKVVGYEHITITKYALFKGPRRYKYVVRDTSKVKEDARDWECVQRGGELRKPFVILFERNKLHNARALITNRISAGTI